MTKSEILEKVQEISDTVYRMSRQIQYQYSDRGYKSAATLLISVSDILDTVEVLISE